MDDQRSDLEIESEKVVSDRIRDAHHHVHRMSVTWSAVALIFLVLFAALYQIFFVAETQWATAAVSASLTAAVAFLFSRRD